MGESNLSIPPGDYQVKPHVAFVVSDNNENPITGEYMLGEHLGSPLRFPLLEFVLLFHIFINFISVGADLGVCPI